MTHTQVFKGETSRNVRLKTKQADVDPEESWSLHCATVGQWHLASPRNPAPGYESSQVPQIPLAPPPSGPASEACH